MAGSEDLERSLRREIENHINARLREHQEEILRAQSELSSALSRLAERLSGEGVDAESLAVSISDHLRNAHGRGAEEASQSSLSARATGDVALLKAAVDDIDAQRTQADILNSLVNRAVSFAPRVAFFVIKNERATGWRARGLEGTVGDDSIREVSISLSSDTVLSEVYRTRASWSGAPGSKADDHQLLSKLGDEPPQRMVAVPLVARDKCVAVLYADSAALESDAINLEALETLVRVAGMAVELLAVKRGAPATATAQPSSAAQTSSAATSQSAERAATDATTGARASQSQAQPTQTEAPSLVETPAAHEVASATPTFEVTPEAAPVSEAVAPSREQATQASQVSAPATSPASESTAPSASSSGATPTAASDAATQPVGSFAAPLGTSRRYGHDAELPVEVSDEERRFHNDARRFARLLVSEIKLYNEQKVRDGREQGNLYDRLRDEIDRSRQMYDKRVHPSVAPRYDYFHQELVNTLAEGDAAKLGAGYPGATVAA